MKILIQLILTIVLIMATEVYGQPHFAINVEALRLPSLERPHVLNQPELQDSGYRFNREDVGHGVNVNRNLNLNMEYQLKSPKSALNRAIAHTAIPIVSSAAILIISNPELFSGEGAGIFMFLSLLFFYGTTVGPSAGNLYADDLNRGIGGILVRSLSWYFILSSRRNSTMKDIGLVGLLGSALYNIATGPVSVRNYNHSIHARLSPAVNPISGSVALTLKLKF